ncbi:ABC transporter ATP-binding protein [Falsochrobactrum ovis]|uniref:Iron complex transport system ATP-binding protein n=1 Tax=Falsochrobactrum ovis TaxID=1293442 RepID=A0A364JXL0_9HYPH|nr:ABC transporter ATP-binding protein [Falsochrobactrum ovis]RAK32193.1 iron complex transport system ATP-binding protein [Falsochrobactrum ovis]
MSLLSVNGLQLSFGHRTVLSGVSFEAEPGEFIGLIGPNGAGKTSLLKAILGLIASDGQLSLENRDLRNMTNQEKARHLAYLPQEREVAWPVAVKTLVSFARAALKPMFEGQDDEDIKLVEAAMRRMDVIRFCDRVVSELSGGEKARVLIARVLAQNTPIILADEPVAGLDPAHQLGLMEVFASLAAEGRTVIASMHELSLAAGYCTRLIVLDQGKVVADGPPTKVLSEELLRSVYGINAHLLDVGGKLIVHPKSVLR